MAKSKRAKRRKHQEETFHESLAVLPTSKPSNLVSYDWDSVGRIGEAAWFDLSRASKWMRQLLWNRRSRAVYLALVAALALGGFVAGSVMAASTYALYASDLSSPAALLAKKQVGTTILDRNGVVLYEAYGAQHTMVAPLATLPKSLQSATLAAEDPNFYSEPGVSWKGIARAAVVDVIDHGKVQGGSTLTQQLIKNSVLTSDKTFIRKFREVVLATNLEQRYTKDQILEMYLNETYYGEGADGIEAASQTYFHVSASKLTLAQGALLAGLPLGPSRLDPNIDKPAATERRNYVLDRMAELGSITTAEAAAAKAEPVTAYPQQHFIRAPWFVFYVLDQLKAKYGESMVTNGGLTVKTTLDITKEEAAEGIVSTQISKLSSHNVTNGALVSLDPKTGDIIAMVGSADYNAPGWGSFNVVTTGQRQPGSSFKPFAYVTSFEKGWTGATTVLDAPLVINTGGQEPYVPQNYDLQFHGNVTLRHALDNSLNIPAIKVVQYAGVDATIATANKLGASINATDASACGVALVLGCAETTPLNMATGYAAFASGGLKVTPRAVLSVSDRYGKEMTKTDPVAPSSVLDPRYAYMMTSILSDNRARLPEFPINSPLRLTTDPTDPNSTEVPAAAKTGTTNSFRDNWTVGYTPGVVTAVWVGNSDNSQMNNVDGITGAAPIWHDYMETALAGTPVQQFAVPAGVTSATVCQADGGLANPWDNLTATDIFPTILVPTKQCATQAPAPTPINPVTDLFKQLFPTSTQAPTPTPTPGVRRRFNPINF